MKNKLSLLMIAMAVFGSLSAQKLNIQNAAIAWEDADKYMNPKQYRLNKPVDHKAAKTKLIDAKKYIDLAAEHEKTNSDQKMLSFRTKIYISITEHPEGNSIDPDAPFKAMMSGLKFVKNDTRGGQELERMRGYLMYAAIYTYRAASNAYYSKEFDKSIELYESIMPVFEYDKNKELERNNVTKAKVWQASSYAAKANGDFEAAKMYLNKLIEMNYLDPQVYIDIVRIYNDQDKDVEKALEYIDKGRNLFEDNAELINMQINIKIEQGKIDELLTDLNEEIEKDPYNPELYYVRGSVYLQKDDNEKAVSDFEKTLENKPGDSRTMFYLGAAYYNWAAEILAKANEIKDNNKYMVEKEKADEKLAKALPNFEAALVADPTNIKIVQKLKEIYAQNSNMEKYNEMKEKEAEIKASQN